MRVAALCSSFTIQQCSSTNFQEKVPHIARQGMRNGSCLHSAVFVWYGMRQCSTAASAWKQPREGNINCGLPESMWSPGVNRLWLYWVESHCVYFTQRHNVHKSPLVYSETMVAQQYVFVSCYLKIGFDIAPMALISFTNKILDCWLLLYRDSVNALPIR